MATTFDYSPLGQLIARKSPDEGKTEFLYDSEGKVRFSQNADQATGNRYTYVNYDKHGRSIESGEYAWTSGGVKFQNFYSLPYVVSGDSVLGKLNELDGLDDGRCAQVNFIYYYPLASGEEIPAGYTHKNKYTQKYQYLCGEVVKTKNANNASWYNYDQWRESTWLVQQFLDSDYTAEKTSVDDQIKTIDYTYDAGGNLSKEQYQKNLWTEDFTHSWSYDADLALTNVEISTNGDSTKTLQAAYLYYLTGELKRTELGVNKLQGIDFVYTVNGELKSINHPSGDAAKDPGKDGDTGSSFDKDIFGMSLDYYAGDYSRNNSNLVSSCGSDGINFYNGLVRAVRYKTKDRNQILRYSGGNVELYPIDSTAHELMDRFTYDDVYQLKADTFGIYKTSLSTFTARDDYRTNGLSYDLNGNITALKRNAYSGNEGLVMDNLGYTYTSNTNKLTTIRDSSTGTYGTDFDAATDKNFTYNNLGQMLTNEAENVTNVKYTADGQVERVVFSGSDTAWYWYNERGIKIKSKYREADNGKSKFTWYVTDEEGAIIAVYEKDQLAGSPADTVIKYAEVGVYGNGRIGVYDVADAKVYYELFDHLGNVRAAVYDSSGITAVKSWADYYEFGSVRPGRNQSVSDYRFSNFQGQESVVKTGNGSSDNWQNFELRMHNSDLGRWMSPDPYAQFYSPYVSMANNPVAFVDPDGGYAGDPGDGDNKNCKGAFKAKYGKSRVGKLFDNIGDFFGGVFNGIGDLLDDITITAGDGGGGYNFYSASYYAPAGNGYSGGGNSYSGNSSHSGSSGSNYGGSSNSSQGHWIYLSAAQGGGKIWVRNGRSGNEYDRGNVKSPVAGPSLPPPPPGEKNGGFGNKENGFQRFWHNTFSTQRVRDAWKIAREYDGYVVKGRNERGVPYATAYWTYTIDNTRSMDGQTVTGVRTYYRRRQPGWLSGWGFQFEIGDKAAGISGRKAIGWNLGSNEHNFLGIPRVKQVKNLTPSSKSSSRRYHRREEYNIRHGYDKKHRKYKNPEKGGWFNVLYWR